MTDLAVSRSSMVEEWERQPGEPQRAFKAFVLYRDDEDERRVTKVRDVFGFAASNATLLRWATEWRWSDRANAYDRYLDRRKWLARAEEIEAAERLQVQIGHELQEKGHLFVQENLDTPEKRASNLTTPGAVTLVRTGTALVREGLGMDKDQAASETNIQINVLDAGTKANLFDKIEAMAANISAARELSIAPPSPAYEDEIVDAELVEDDSTDGEP